MSFESLDRDSADRIQREIDRLREALELEHGRLVTAECRLYNAEADSEQFHRIAKDALAQRDCAVERTQTLWDAIQAALSSAAEEGVSRYPGTDEPREFVTILQGAKVE